MAGDGGKAEADAQPDQRRLVELPHERQSQQHGGGAFAGIQK